MAHKEAQVALLNVMQKEVTRIVLFEEWDSEFHIFVKQMRAQNRGRPDVKLARLCLQMATTLFGEELGRGYEMRRDSGADGDGGATSSPRCAACPRLTTSGATRTTRTAKTTTTTRPMTTSTPSSATRRALGRSRACRSSRAPPAGPIRWAARSRRARTRKTASSPRPRRLAP